VPHKQHFFRPLFIQNNPMKTNTKFMAALAAAALCILTATAQAGHEWKEGIVGDWENAANWDVVSVPMYGSPDVTYWSIISGGTATVSSSVSADGFLRIGNKVGTGKAVVQITASGTLTSLGQDGNPNAGNIYIADATDAEMVIDGGKVITKIIMVSPNNIAYNAVLTMTGSASVELIAGGEFYNGYYGRGLTILADDASINAAAAFKQYYQSTLAIAPSAMRGGGGIGTTDLAFITADTIILAGSKLDLLSEQLFASDDFTIILFQSTSSVTARFDTILVDGEAVVNLSNDGTVYTFDNLEGNQHYTLDYNYGSGTQVALSVQVDPVPEPTTWALIAGGFGVLTVAMRRRKGPGL
jgi:hypothetical protein